MLHFEFIVDPSPSSVLTSNPLDLEGKYDLELCALLFSWASISVLLLGRRRDNPDIQQFGYNSNTIRAQRSVSCETGNTHGIKKSKAWVNISDDPLPSRFK